MPDPTPYSESGLASELDNLKDTNVYRWLKDQIRINAKNLNTARDEVAFRWLQGGNQALESIVNSIDDAAEKAWTAREAAKRHAEMKKLRQATF